MLAAFSCYAKIGFSYKRLKVLTLSSFDTFVTKKINWRQNDSVCFHLIEASVVEARVL